MSKPVTIATFPPRLAWRDAVATLRAQPTHSRLLGGSLIMLTGTGLVSALNFGFNVAVARMLGPGAFGQAAAAVTLLMLVSAITLSFQLVAAKFIAKNETAGGRAAVYSTLLRRSWKVGLLLGAALVFASGAIASYLNLPSASMVVLLAFGIAFYAPLGVKRGGLQGVCSFGLLSWNFILEAGIKFSAALFLVAKGFGINGAVAAISISVVLAYFVPGVPKELRSDPEAGTPASFREGIQAIVFFVGQVVINNIDILLVKHFFPSEMAGLYAAVALVGRVVYLASWSVVSAMFPISAGTNPRENNSAMLIFPLLLVLGISLGAILLLGLFPDTVLQFVFGFRAVAGLDSLMSLYAAATGAYALSVVLITFEMSRRIANTGWLQLLFSGLIVLGISLFHNTLRQVVEVQLVLMVIMLAIVSTPFFRRTPATSLQEAA
jgi:O-antigen/teichoic acid export membrane protein